MDESQKNVEVPIPTVHWRKKPAEVTENYWEKVGKKFGEGLLEKRKQTKYELIIFLRKSEKNYDKIWHYKNKNKCSRHKTTNLKYGS